MKTADELKQDIEFKTSIRDRELTFKSTWGLFCPKSIDRGTGLLIHHVSIQENETILDLGCGYGALGVTLGVMNPGASVYMVDKDFVAVEYAEKNAQENHLSDYKVLLSNGLREIPDDVKFTTIVANLPANAGRELLFILMSDAYEHLEKNGQMVVVTISGLRKFIKKNFEHVFGNYEKIKQRKTHTVARAFK